MTATTTDAPRVPARRRLAGSLWRHPKAQLGLLLAGPIGWLVIAYLGSLAVLFAAAFWHLDTFSGQVVQGFSLDNFRTLAEEGVYRSIVARYAQIRRYVEDWQADALVIHSIKSCRLFSAGQGDMREYFIKDLGVPTLLVESDLEDPRYYAEAQIRNRVDAFFEALEHKKLVATR